VPVIHVAVDHLGRPVVELAVSISSTDRVTQPTDAVLPPRTVRALVDTGAAGTHVALGVLEDLQLISLDVIAVYTASTRDYPEVMPLYSVDLSLVGDQPGPLSRNLRVVGSDRLSGLQVEMLLGRDVLKGCLLIYDGANRRFSLAYNPPTPTLF